MSAVYAVADPIGSREMDLRHRLDAVSALAAQALAAVNIVLDIDGDRLTPFARGRLQTAKLQLARAVRGIEREAR